MQSIYVVKQKGNIFYSGNNFLDALKTHLINSGSVITQNTDGGTLIFLNSSLKKLMTADSWVPWNK